MLTDWMLRKAISPPDNSSHLLCYAAPVVDPSRYHIISHW
jgi:hypothetical protein